MSQLKDTKLYTDAALEAYWPLSDANDDLGGFNFTNNGTSTFTAGKYGDAGTFNGTTQYLSLADGIITGSGDKSMVGWGLLTAQPATNVDQSPFVWGNATHRFLLRYRNEAGTMQLRIADGAVFNIIVNKTLLSNTWYHFAVTHSSGRVFILYLNGVPIGSGTTAVASNAAISTGVAAQSFEGANFWPGQVDDVAFFSKVLTEQEIGLLAFGNKSFLVNNLRPRIFAPGIAR